MGLILVAVGLAVPSLSDWIAIPLVFGTIVNPFLFVPQAFSREVENRLWYRSPAIVSFLRVSGGLVAVAVTGPGQPTRQQEAMDALEQVAISPG